MTCVATLRSDSPRAETWREVYGSLSVPILSPIALRAQLPGRGPSLVYLVDVRALSPDVIERVIAYCAETFDMSVEVVREGLRRGFVGHDGGLPILVDADLDVTMGAVELSNAIASEVMRVFRAPAGAPAPELSLFGADIPRGQT